MPGKILDLTNWHETLPTVNGQLGNALFPADQINPPQLLTYSSPYFHVNNTGDGVVFTAPVNGARTSTNTNYPRSELRERTSNGTQLASWGSNDGLVHRMVAREAVTHLPVNKPQHVFCQIHGTSGVSSNSSDLLECEAFGLGGNVASLRLKYNNDQDMVEMDGNYILGTPIDLELVVSNGLLEVYYNGQLSLSTSLQDKGLYFKIGAYVQSNSSYDASNAYGETVVYNVNVTHSLQ